MLMFTAYMQREYKGTPLAEIREAYGMAIKGTLPGVNEVYPVLNPFQLGKIMKAWNEYKVQQLEQVNRSQRGLELPEAPPPTEAELDKSFLEILSIALRGALAGKAFTDYGNGVYNFLDRIGQLEFTSEDKYKAMDVAKSELLKDARQSPTNRDPLAERSRLKQLQQLIEDATEPENIVTNRAKKILLARLISDVAYEGEEYVNEYLQKVSDLLK
jgi:hypothetical protein